MPSEAAIEWFCENGPESELGANGFPTETCSTHLQTLLYFPNCVNTETLETGYKEGRPGAYYDCPEGMQAMPQLRFSIRYDLREALVSFYIHCDRSRHPRYWLYLQLIKKNANFDLA